MRLSIVTYRHKQTSRILQRGFATAEEAIAYADRHSMKRAPGKPDGTWYRDQRDPIIQSGHWDFHFIQHGVPSEDVLLGSYA